MLYSPLHPRREQRLYQYITRLPGLQGYYPLWEIDGSTAYNHAPATRKTQDGAITGATKGVVGKIGKAYNFVAGSSQYVDLGTSTNLQLLTNFSIGAIVKTGSDITSTQTILNRGKNGSNARDYIFNVASSKLNLQRSDGGSFPTVSGNSTLSTSTYYFFGASFNGTTGIVYVNGVSDNSASLSLSISSDTARSTSIGRTLQTAGSSLYLGGDVQHVFFSNQVLTAGQFLKMSKLAGF